jgi:hypothetical protein
MTDLRFELDWESVSGSRGDELAATWARLAIRVGDATVTSVNDYRSRALRDHVLIPLYPLAEWLATHWWLLLYEVPTPGREDYERRHNLRFGREGFALPDLSIEPSGERTSLKWRAFDLPDARIGFTGAGTCNLELEGVRQSFADLIETVLARLDQQGVAETYLHREWQAIQSADEDEAAFCIAAARLGQDPYAIEQPLSQAIVTAANRLPAHWQEEFFNIADARTIEEQATLVNEARALAMGTAGQFESLVELRAETEKIHPKRAPWDQGYRVARTLRQRLGLAAEPLGNDAELTAALKIPSLGYTRFGEPGARRWLDGLVECADDEGPAFLTTKSWDQQVRFAFCRGLFEYLTVPDTPSALTTAARTDRQQRNRAFAAEFLAPADWLRGRIVGTWASADEMDDWAAKLGVSEEVVRRQIQNHRLAFVEGMGDCW